jgi:hypothetical protein
MNNTDRLHMAGLIIKLAGAAPGFDGAAAPAGSDIWGSIKGGLRGAYNYTRDAARGAAGLSRQYWNLPDIGGRDRLNSIIGGAGDVLGTAGHHAVNLGRMADQGARSIVNNVRHFGDDDRLGGFLRSTIGAIGSEQRLNQTEQNAASYLDEKSRNPNLKYKAWAKGRELSVPRPELPSPYAPKAVKPAVAPTAPAPTAPAPASTAPAPYGPRAPMASAAAGIPNYLRRA